MKPPRITRITVARLHNLGNYEHSRIEVEVAIPKHASAGATLQHVQSLLEELDPKCPVADWSLANARRVLAQTETPGEHDLESISAARATIAAYEEWQEKQARAYDALDHLGSVRCTGTGQEDI